MSKLPLENIPASNDIVVRTLGHGADLADVRTVRRSVNWLRDVALGKHDEYLVAFLADDPLGLLMMRTDRSTDGLPNQWVARRGAEMRVVVHEIAVVPGARRRGVGRTLVASAAMSARDRNINWLWTWPSPRGGEARREERRAFFRSCGFELEPADEDNQAPGMDALVADVLRAVHEAQPRT